MLELDDNTRRELKLLQKRPSNKRIYIKVTVLLMLDKGLSVQVIADFLGIDDNTVYRYRDSYLTNGLKDYLASNYFRYNGKLTDEEKARLVAELTEYLYPSSAAVGEFIAATFNKHYCESAVSTLLNRLGFVYKKTKSVPSKADSAAQRRFVKKLHRLLKKQDVNAIFYFNDAAHPQHNTRPAYGWIPKGEDVGIPSNTGRKRLNINAAINAEDVGDIVFREDEQINSQSTIALWEAQHAKHPGKKIYNICDNARYYKSHLIQEWLKKNKWCKVIYLPAYSPNLNIIERLWKYLRKSVIDYFYYEKYSDFKVAILTFFETIEQHRQPLTSLLTLNFHIP